MQGKCRLCDSQADLQESHLIPAFVFRWRKETSPTPFMRSSMDPERRVQDGIKEYWLCRECEQKISQWEGQFASKIFHPITRNGSHRIAYARWLLKFCVSISWRALFAAKEQTGLTQLSETHRAAADKALHTWREFMWDRAPHPGPFEQHFILFEDIASFDSGPLPANLHRYTMRTIEFDIPSTTAFAFTFIKMGPFAVLGFFHLKKPKGWQGGKVHVNQGHVGPARYQLPIEFRDYLFRRAQKAAAIMEGLSAEQRAVADRATDAALAKGKANLGASHWLKAMQRDFDLFGEEAFKTGWPGRGKDRD